MLTLTIPCPDCANEMAQRVSPYGKGWYCSECDWFFTDDELDTLEEAEDAWLGEDDQYSEDE